MRTAAACVLLGVGVSTAFCPASVAPALRKSWGTTRMSLFPDGSGATGAVRKEKGVIRVAPPRELDNSDPFVLDTMTVRVPVKIIGRTVEYNKGDIPDEACAGMAKVQEEMQANAKITALSKGPNVQHWNQCLKPYLDKSATWNELPWYVAETYVYHRLLEASGYWDEGVPGFGHDIFAKEKAEALQQVLPQVAVRMNTCVESAGEWSATRFRSLLHMALWGNQGDSSLFTVSEMSAKGGADTLNSRLLVDDTDLIFNHLDSSLDPSKSEVHMFNDNSGMEIVSDLALVHYLLSSGKLAKVVLQVNCVCAHLLLHGLSGKRDRNPVAVVWSSLESRTSELVRNLLSKTRC